MHTGCLILGILFLFYYVLIGCYAGFRTSLSWLWALGGVFFLLLGRAFVCQAGHPKLAYVTGAGLALAAVGLAVVLILGSRVVSAMHIQPEENLPYVIVLGAQVRGTRPSRALRMRMDAALTYARENPQTVFILSGGQGPDEEITEAQCMYDYMTAQGLEADRLLLEDRSTSTEENLKFSDALYRLRDSRVGVLSNSFHLYRALALAKHAGYRHVSGLPAPSDFWMQPHNVLREVCGLLAAAVGGKL